MNQLTIEEIRTIIRAVRRANFIKIVAQLNLINKMQLLLVRNSSNISIEEIHIGFQYEELIPNPERYMRMGDYIWIKRIYDFNSPRLHKMQKLIDENKIRKI